MNALTLERGKSSLHKVLSAALHFQTILVLSLVNIKTLSETFECGLSRIVLHVSTIFTIFDNVAHLVPRNLRS